MLAIGLMLDLAKLRARAPEDVGKLEADRPTV
jgi:hypothetical protein